MRNGTGRMGLAALGVILGVGAVTLAPLPAERGVALAQADAKEREFNVDPVHSSILFGIKHVGIAYTYGRFNEMSGTFHLDENDLAGSFVTIEINTNSVDTANEKRDQHLRSPDFFNTKVFPKATFNSTSFEKQGNTIMMTGEMVINGKANEIVVPLEITGEGMAMGSMRQGFHAEFPLSRSAYGISWRPEALGDEVRMIVSIEGIQADD